MTRITLFFFLLLSISIHTVNAQKIDLDKRKFDTEFAILPTDPTLSYFDMYSVDFFIEQPTFDQLGLTESTINNYFDLGGYVYTKDQSEFNYSISIDKPIALLEGIQDVQETVKNPDGTTKVVTKFVAISTYAIPTNISIRLVPSGTLLYTSSFSTRSLPTVYKSAPQITRDAAQSILNMKYKGINTSLLDVYTQTLKSEVTKLKQTYCFQGFTSSSLLWEVDEKSAPELAPFNKEVNTCLDILQKLTKSTPIKNARIEMEPSIKYWTDKATSLQGSDKNVLKLKYACYYNLAVCQYYLELYDACITNCKLLVLNTYNKNDGTILQNQAVETQKMLQESALKSRHHARPGFKTTDRFEYKKIVIKKPNFIEQNKQDLKELKDAGSSLGNVAVDIYKDVTPPKITDTLKSSETYFSYVRFSQNGEQVELKGRELGTGTGKPNAMAIHETALYTLFIFRKDALITRKEGTVDGFGINIRSNYKNSTAFNADSLIALIKLYQNDKLMDITISERDTVEFRNNGRVERSKIVLGKDYAKKIAADANISYHLHGTEGNQDYMTNNGDSFNISIVDVVPVLVKDINYGNMIPNSYLVTFKIPEITLTKIMIGHRWFYTYEYVTLKNIEMRVLLLSPVNK